MRVWERASLSSYLCDLNEKGRTVLVAVGEQRCQGRRLAMSDIANRIVPNLDLLIFCSPHD
jgi:hypothetical protein